ncbi:MAG: HAD family hydrolase [Syntrophobacteraceae bacterium]
MDMYRANPQTLNFSFPQPLKVVAFDCDGVLFDSKEANVHFYNHVLERFGHSPLRPDQHEYVHMHPVRNSLWYLLQEKRAFEQAMDYVLGIDFHEFHRFLRREPGLVEMFENVKASYRIAMATNRTVSTRDVLVEFDLYKYFDLVVSASDVANPKPHPEIMERILDFFEVSPQEVLYVGDSLVDEDLAAATGVYFAAYKNPELKAHLHINHFRELQALLSGTF